MFDGVRLISRAFIGLISWCVLVENGLLQYEIEESDDTTVTEEADFSLILKGAELDVASYTYARDEGWLFVVLEVEVSDFDEEGDAALFNVVIVDNSLKAKVLFQNKWLGIDNSFLVLPCGYILR